MWQGLDALRLEVARVELHGDDLRAEGAQVGVAYELRYRLDGGVLELDVLGGPSARVEPGEADFVDLGFSPLTNTLPILRDRLIAGGASRDYVMALVEVPSLAVTLSAQRYEPVAPRRIGFSSGDFSTVLEVDDDGLVVRYPELAQLAGGSRP